MDAGHPPAPAGSSRPPAGSIEGLRGKGAGVGAEGTAVLDHRSLAELEALAGEDEPEFLETCVRTFVEDTSHRLRTLAEALALGDADALRRTAHALKGASATVGAQHMAARALDLEQRGRTRELDGATLVLAELHREFGAVSSELASYVTRRRTPR
jgi:HPt (histidine-containing phosphotransfer) domain-containing protein